MSNEQVIYADLKVAKEPRKHQRKPKTIQRSISVTEQEITYAEIILQRASQERPESGRDCLCKELPSPPEKLIAGLLGIVCFAFTVALVVTTIASYPEIKKQNNSLKEIGTQKANSCVHCPKDWLTYSHNCYYMSREKKTWNESLLSCTFNNSNLLYIDNQEELDFLKFILRPSWTRVFRKSRTQPWQSKNDSTFKLKITDASQDDYNCAMVTASGLTAENCTSLHTHHCKHGVGD